MFNFSESYVKRCIISLRKKEYTISRNLVITQSNEDIANNCHTGLGSNMPKIWEGKSAKL